MKKLLIVLSILLCVVSVLGFCFNKDKQIEINTTDLLRIHIRANSNSQIDQNIKFKIKDEFINYLTPKVAMIESKEEAIKLIQSQKNELTEIANKVLSDNNFSYKAKIQIREEYFPTRVYENYVVASGVYDSIIVELGESVGNNWWCVIYPPLCFTNFSNNYQSIVYKSKIMEIINKFFS